MYNIICCLFLIYSLLCIPAYAFIEPFEIKAGIMPEEIQPNESGVINVSFSIASEHYLYADKVEIIIDKIPGLSFDKPEKPPGKKEEDPYVGTVYTYEGSITVKIPFNVEAGAETGQKKIGITVNYQGCTKKLCFPPKEKRLELILNVLAPSSTKPDVISTVKNNMPDDKNADKNPFRKTAESFGLIGVMAAAFIWGLFASLTPCVYPMIPVTVSVIGAKSAGSALRGFFLSIIYVFGISLTYAVFGMIAAMSGSVFGAYTAHPAVRIIVAAVFVILALSMFDIFYLQMPSSISSKFSKVSGSGIFGVFLTGAAAGAVVGPCVGPMLVALLVYIAGLGDKLQGFLIMWSFALGMGMLFMIIGTFSGFAASLPKSGAWMDKLKRVFGVIMLGVALYYIKPLLTEQLFILITGFFLIGVGVFGGAFKKLNAKSSRYDRFLKAGAILCLIIGIGFAFRFTLSNMMPSRITTPNTPGISWLNDEPAVIAQAAKIKKPVMIDFTANWCAACQHMEHKTFSNPSVIEQARRFLPLRIDCSNPRDPTVKELVKKYRISGLPTIIFIDSNGNIVHEETITQFVASKALLDKMRRIK